jgi:tetrapyrrole methylase family protein/MazG family protein
MDALSLDQLFARFELEGYLQVCIVDAVVFIDAHMPTFAPDSPALIKGVTAGNIGSVKTVLLNVYPAEHILKVVASGRVMDIPLAKIESAEALCVPALPKGASFESFQEIIAHLRAPEDGCPWDKEQTHLTLRKHLLEECYETLAALDAEDPQKMREEFGDLLLQIVLNAQIANEFNEFRMGDVIKSIYDKIIRRHPHVFGDVSVNGVGDVLQNWEKIKAGERRSNGEHEKGLLDGLPAALPGLSQAHEYQDRAARVGFDWPEIEGVLDKIKEEIEEVRRATNQAELQAELGDLFFALVNLARWKKVDAESALREANIRFKRRFGYVETGARQQARMLSELSFDEMEALWQEAKRAGL